MTGSKIPRIIGWVISILIAVMLIGVSARMKLSPPAEMLTEFEKMGFTADVMFKIGIVEAVCALLYVIPPTGFLGAILLTGYLGGATVTHVRGGQPVWIPVVFGIVVWIALGLRRPEVFKMAFGCGCAKSPPPA